jgi:hypothetical protein
MIASEVGDELIDDGVLTVNYETVVSGRAWYLSYGGEVMAEEDFTGAASARSLVQVRRDGGSWLLFAWG